MLVLETLTVLELIETGVEQHLIRDWSFQRNPENYDFISIFKLCRYDKIIFNYLNNYIDKLKLNHGSQSVEFRDLFKRISITET